MEMGRWGGRSRITMKKRVFPVCVTAGMAILCIGIVVGYTISVRWCPCSTTRSAYREKRLPSPYKFINPLLECETYAPTLHRFVLLRHEINQYIEATERAEGVSHISVYLRDMASGAWMGIGEQDRFAPASLLKVPLMMAILKEAETNPAILQQKIYCAADSAPIPQHYDAPTSALNQERTVEDLLFNTIAYSDNEAANCLGLNLQTAFFDRVYADLEVTLPDIRTPRDFITVKEYASFFRILYNSTYLSEEMSEKALEILSKSVFEKGIIAGLPAGTIVAHKFGERSDDTSDKQFHDCGIVYYKDSPYLLCVMTKGTDTEELPAIIAEISKRIYEYYEAKHAEKSRGQRSPDFVFP